MHLWPRVATPSSSRPWLRGAEMEDRAVRGVPWTLISYALNRVVLLLTLVVLARLLVPEDFGLVTLAVIAVQLANVLSDLGLSGTLVLRQDLDEQAKGTVLMLMLATSVLLAAILAASAPLIADLFNEPRLAGVLAVLSLGVVISGVTWFYETTLQRELEFRRRFLALAVQAVAYAGVAIALAALGAGVWSLVAGQLSSLLAFAAILVWLAPYRVRPAFNRDDAREILGTSKGFLLQGGLGFVSGNVDYFSVGSVLGATSLGFYSMAYRLGEVTYYGIADPVAKVTFPAFSRMRHRGEEVSSPFLSTLRLVALVACPVGVLLSAAAHPFTEVVFGEKWFPMIGPLAVLGVWAAVRPVQATIAWLLNSVGEAAVMGVIDVIVMLPLLPALVLAAHLGGITAVAWVMLAYMVVSGFVLAVLVHRRGGVSLADQWRALMPVLIACVVSWAATRGVAEAMAGGPAAAALVASVATGTACFLATVSVIEPGLLRVALRQIARTLGRGQAAVAEPG
jgi:lipopolysaccharide exporter